LTSPGHLDAVARLVAGRVGRRPLRWVAQRPELPLARDLGVLEAVDECRDLHLATLGADEGLTVLLLPWEEIVREAAVLVNRAAARECPRCGARLGRRANRCSRCRLLAPRRGA
jgi:hypothetical protein